MTAQTVVQQVAAHVTATPDAIAIADGTRTWSYQQLWTAAVACRDYLQSRQISPGDIVALHLPRGIELASAVFGTWLAGATYLPIDPEAPTARQQQVLQDATPAAVLTAAPWLTEPETSPSSTDDIWPVAESPAYLIYTSGSTGLPKGVLIPHRALSNLVAHLQQTLATGAHTRMLWLTKFSFDMSVPELFLPLASGGTCCPVPDAARADGEALAEAWLRATPNIVQGTPSTWRIVLRSVRRLLGGITVMIGGEPSPPDLLTALLEAGARVLHCYGPTETTVWSTTGWIELPVSQPVPAGFPIRHTTVECVTAEGTVATGSEVGEVRILGSGLALGYHNRPELTAKSFVDDPQRGRYYRTGDLGRWDPRGQLVLLGRADRQVKVHGNRIELGDVEAALTDHSRVDFAAVEVVEADGERLLGAVVQAADATPEELLEHLRQRLPRAMLPSRIRFIAEMPLTANGKVDHLAVQEMLLSKAPAPVPGPVAWDDVPDPVRAEVAAIWSDMLPDADTISADTHFFLSGGHSLLAALCLQRIEDDLDVRISLEDLFAHPTFAAFSDLVVAAAGPRRHDRTP